MLSVSNIVDEDFGSVIRQMSEQVMVNSDNGANTITLGNDIELMIEDGPLIRLCNYLLTQIIESNVSNLEIKSLADTTLFEIYRKDNTTETISVSSCVYFHILIRLVGMMELKSQCGSDLVGVILGKWKHIMYQIQVQMSIQSNRLVIGLSTIGNGSAN